MEEEGPQAAAAAGDRHYRRIPVDIEAHALRIRSHAIALCLD